MPGNLIIINGSMEWYVGDSMVDELIDYLDKIGHREIGVRDPFPKPIPHDKDNNQGG